MNKKLLFPAFFMGLGVSFYFSTVARGKILVAWMHNTFIRRHGVVDWTRFIWRVDGFCLIF